MISMLALLLSAAFQTVANTRHNRLANAIILQHLKPFAQAERIHWRSVQANSPD